MPSATIKPAGGNYTSATNAESTEQGLHNNLTGLGPMVFTFDAYADTGVTTDGWTTTAADYIQWIAAVGQRHAGKYDGAKFRFTGQWENWEEYVRLEYCQFRCTTGIAIMLNGGVGADVRIARNVIDGCTGMTYLIRADHVKALIAWNVFNNNVKSQSYDIRGGGSGTPVTYIYNNTFRGPNASSDGGILSVAGTMHTRNNDFFNTAGNTLDNLSTLNVNYTKTDDTRGDDFGGTGNVANVTLPGTTFVDASNGDLHLSPGDTVLGGAGQDLSSDPDSYGGSVGSWLATDIDGNTVSGSWPIGADHLAAAATKAPPAFRRPTRFFSQRF